MTDRSTLDPTCNNHKRFLYKTKKPCSIPARTRLEQRNRIITTVRSWKTASVLEK